MLQRGGKGRTLLRESLGRAVLRYRGSLTSLLAYLEDRDVVPVRFGEGVGVGERGNDSCGTGSDHDAFEGRTGKIDVGYERVVDTERSRGCSNALIRQGTFEHSDSSIYSRSDEV